jgi:hypothetical protein
MHSGGESSDDDLPSDSRLQSSTYPSSRVKEKNQNLELEKSKLENLEF